MEKNKTRYNRFVRSDHSSCVIVYLSGIVCADVGV